MKKKFSFLARHILTESILATKALDFALLCKEDKFKASNGWLDNFKSGTILSSTTFMGKRVVYQFKILLQ